MQFSIWKSSHVQIQSQLPGSSGLESARAVPSLKTLAALTVKIEPTPDFLTNAHIFQVCRPTNIALDGLTRIRLTPPTLDKILSYLNGHYLPPRADGDRACWQIQDREAVAESRLAC